MDEQQWIDLFRRLMPPLYAGVSRRVGAQRALAEDVTQEAWLRALNAWRRDGLPEDPGAWLRTVAANLLRSHYRRQARGPRAELDAGREPEAPTPDASLHDPGAQARRADALQRGLARLRPEQAELLAERYLEGRASREIAAERGLGERALEGRLRRARLALARHIDAGLLEEPADR